MTIEDITIIITSFRSKHKINICLNSIDKKVKVLVIENSKDKEFKESIEKQYSNVECYLTGENLGYAKANNIGLKKCTTKFSLVLNPDTILEENTLKNLIHLANKYKDFYLIGPFNQQDKKIVNNSKYIEAQDAIEVENLKGYAIFFNMNKFKDIGFFDENYFLYFEEIDLCKKIKKINGKIYAGININIFHDGAKSVQDNNFELEKNRNWHWMWSTFYFYQKNYNYSYAFILILPKLLSSIIKTIFFLIIFNKKRKDVYFQRLKGLINSILGKSSWYRPTLH